MITTRACVDGVVPTATLPAQLRCGTAQPVRADPRATIHSDTVQCALKDQDRIRTSRTPGTSAPKDLIAVLNYLGVKLLCRLHVEAREVETPRHKVPSPWAINFWIVEVLGTGPTSLTDSNPKPSGLGNSYAHLTSRRRIQLLHFGGSHG